MTAGNDELRALASAPAQHEAVAEVPTRSVLVLRAGQRWFGVDPRQVHEVIVRGSVTPVPIAPPHLLGLTLVRGRLVPVLSLQELLGYRGEGEPAQTLPRLAILRHGTIEAGIVCDETRGIAEVESRDVAAGAASRPRCVAAELEWNGTLLLLLDAAELMRTALGEGEAA